MLGHFGVWSLIMLANLFGTSNAQDKLSKNNFTERRKDEVTTDKRISESIANIQQQKNNKERKGKLEKNNKETKRKQK